MLPYLTIPIALPGNEALNNPDKEVPCKILPGQVLAYHEGYAWGTCIYLSTGQAFMSTLSVEAYERAVRMYWDQVDKNNKHSLKLLQ